MIELSLQRVATLTGGAVDDAVAPRTVTRVVTDSRAAEPGALFVALRGESADGHDFIEDAIARGATGVLAESGRARDVHGVVTVADSWRAIGALGAGVRAEVDPRVVAITGSVGKTTTKDLTAAALGARWRTVAAEGSFNNELGVPLTLLQIAHDTEAAVVEVGARGLGHIAALMPIVRPTVSVVTAVAAAHTELFGDLDTVARAKGELVEALPADGCAVLNADDPRVRAMAERSPAMVIRYGRNGGDVVAEDVRLDELARARFEVRSPWGSAEVVLPLAGEHHVGNALAALAVAGHLAVPMAAAAAALADAPISPWRSELTEHGGVAVLNDAYNANPTSVSAALRTLAGLRERRGGRAIAVLGQMAELGAGSAEAHADLGREAAALGIDLLVVVRGGDAESIAEGAPTGRVTIVDDAASAAAAVLDHVGPGDVVLTKASRVAGLEEVAAALADRLGAEGGR